MDESVESLRCIQEAAVDIAAIRGIVIDSLFEAVNGVRRGRLPLEAKLIA